MLEIEAAQRAPLDQLAMDYFNAHRPEQPSSDFCRRICGVSDRDEVVAKRLDVRIAEVRSWRKAGRLANQWSCW